MFLNLTNRQLSVNTYRFPKAMVTTQNDLLKSHKEGSKDCLTASIANTLEIFRQPDSEKYLVSFCGLNGDGDFCNNEKAHIVASDVDNAIEKACPFWGLKIENIIDVRLTFCR